MGIYGFIDIQVEFKDNATPNEIEAFCKEIDNTENLTISGIDNCCYTIENGRMQNLEFQINLFETVVKKHSCVLSANGNAYCEAYVGVCYDAEEEVEE